MVRYIMQPMSYVYGLYLNLRKNRADIIFILRSFISGKVAWNEW